MLADLLKALSVQAVQATGIRTAPVPGGPAHKYLLLHPDGTVQEREAERSPRRHLAGCLDTVVALAKRFENDASVWYSREGVVALLADTTGRDRVVLPLGLSPQIQFVQKWEGTVWYGHRDTLRLLRVNLAGCLGDSKIGDIIRSCKFKVGSDVEATHTHVKASVSRQQMAETSGLTAIPETVVLDLPIFAGNQFPMIRGRVTVAVECDPQKEAFSFTPLPGQIEAVILDAELSVGGALREDLGEHFPLYHGKPE